MAISTQKKEGPHQALIASSVPFLSRFSALLACALQSLHLSREPPQALACSASASSSSFRADAGLPSTHTRRPFDDLKCPSISPFHPFGHSHSGTRTHGTVMALSSPARYAITKLLLLSSQRVICSGGKKPTMQRKIPCINGLRASMQWLEQRTFLRFAETGTLATSIDKYIARSSGHDRSRLQPLPSSNSSPNA